MEFVSGFKKRLLPQTSPYYTLVGGNHCSAAFDMYTIVDSRLRRLWQHRCSALRLLEHAVSKEMLGPRKSKNQLSLFASIAGPVPVALYFAWSSGSLQNMTSYSREKEPTNTDVLLPIAVSIGIPASREALHVSFCIWKDDVTYHFLTHGRCLQVSHAVEGLCTRPPPVPSKRKAHRRLQYLRSRNVLP